MEIIGVCWSCENSEVSQPFGVGGCGLFSTSCQKFEACSSSFKCICRLNEILSSFEYAGNLKLLSAKFLIQSQSDIHHSEDSPVRQYGETLLQLFVQTAGSRPSTVHIIVRSWVVHHI